MLLSYWPKLNKVLEIHPDSMISGFNEQVYIPFLIFTAFIAIIVIQITVSIKPIQMLLHLISTVCLNKVRTSVVTGLISG